MINKEIYVSQFSEYIDLIKSDTIEFENIFNYTKQYDAEYIEELDKKQDDIVDELKSWKKFYVNNLKNGNYKKESFRDFEPIITKGEIEEFILSKLDMFDRRTGEFVGWERVAERLIKNQVRKIEYARDVLSAYNSLLNTYNNIKKITGIDLKNATVADLKKYLLEAGTRLKAIDVVKAIEDSLPNDIPSILKDKVNKKGFIDFMFDAITDYRLSELDDEEFGTIRKQLEFRFREFVTKGIFKNKQNQKIQMQDVFNLSISMFEDIKKDFIRSKSIFEFSFTNSLAKTINKQMSVFDFNSNVRSMLRTYGRRAFRSGVTTVGLDPIMFRPIENFLIRRMNSYVNYYLTGLTTRILAGSIDIGRAMVTGESWSNRTLERFFDYGRLAADRNGLYEWVYGDTKHCISCLRANGQRHRLRHWHESGILPKSNGYKTLKCKGYHCKCKLIRVTGGSRGRLDRIPTV